MAWYDLDKNQTQSKRDYLAQCRYDKSVGIMADRFTDIIEQELKQGVQYRIVTENSFNAVVILDAIDKLYDIDEVIIAVYRMNINAVNRIKEWAEKIPCTVLLSSFFRENKKYEQWTREIELFAKSNKMKLAFAWSHAKIFLAKTKCGKHIVFEGSGNLSDNARIEQYILEDNRQIYDFHKSWINEIINDENKGR